MVVKAGRCQNEGMKYSLCSRSLKVSDGGESEKDIVGLCFLFLIVYILLKP
jgi:hypothetical protein